MFIFPIFPRAHIPGSASALCRQQLLRPELQVRVQLRHLGQMGEDQVCEPERQGVHRRAGLYQCGRRGLRGPCDPREVCRGRAEEVRHVRWRHALGRRHRIQ